MHRARDEAQLVIGVDIGGTNMQLGVVDASGAIVGRAAVKTGAERGLDAVLDTIHAGAHEACGAAGTTIDDVAAVGIAAAGAIDIPHGVVLEAPNLGWTDVPLRDLVSERVGRPVVLENDVNGATLGEYHFGAGAGGGRGDVFGIWVGTGVGGGLILNGRIHHGAYFTAGEIGHTVIDPRARDRAGRATRTVEDHCSRTGMRRILGERLPEHPDSSLHELTGDDIGRLGMHELRRAYQGGDELTVSVVDAAADLIGIAIANTVTLLAIDLVFVGGGVTEALGDPYLERIRASFRRSVFPDRCAECRIVMTELAADAGLLGAAIVARESLRAPG